MNHLREKMKLHPLAAAGCALLVYFLSVRLFGLFFKLLPEGLLTSFLVEFTGISFSFAMVMFCGYGRIYRQRGLFRTLLIAAPHLLFFTLILIAGIINAICSPEIQWLPPARIVLGVLTLFGIGFNEESLFRGVVANLIAEKGMNSRRDIFRTVFLSAFLFGSTHILNLLSGTELSSVLFQCIGAFATGCLFCAYYLRGGSFWALVLLHMIQDASGLFEFLFVEGGSIVASINEMGSGTLIPSAVLLLITLFLLRKSSCEKIIALRARTFPKA